MKLTILFAVLFFVFAAFVAESEAIFPLGGMNGDNGGNGGGPLQKLFKPTQNQGQGQDQENCCNDEQKDCCVYEEQNDEDCDDDNKPKVIVKDCGDGC